MQPSPSAQAKTPPPPSAGGSKVLQNIPQGTVQIFYSRNNFWAIFGAHTPLGLRDQSGFAWAYPGLILGFTVNPPQGLTQNPPLPCTRACLAGFPPFFRRQVLDCTGLCVGCGWHTRGGISVPLHFSCNPRPPQDTLFGHSSELALGCLVEAGKAGIYPGEMSIVQKKQRVGTCNFHFLSVVFLALALSLPFPLSATSPFPPIFLQNCSSDCSGRISYWLRCSGTSSWPTASCPI